MPLLQLWFRFRKIRPGWYQNYSQRAPLKRSGRQDEIADAVTFLINLEFATGHLLVLDGGRSV